MITPDGLPEPELVASLLTVPSSVVQEVAHAVRTDDREVMTSIAEAATDRKRAVIGLHFKVFGLLR